MNQKRKVAIVTGAGAGIGRASSIALLKEGYSVIVAGRQKATLDETILQANEYGENALAIPTDLRNPSSIQHLFKITDDTFGRLDVLFNNAGVNVPSVELDDLTYEQWTSVVETNLTGTFLCTQEAFRMMKRQQPQGGRIINNGSVSAHVPRPGSAPYTATKHAITGLTKSTALDGRKYNIACSQIDIGNASTPLTRRMEKGVPQADGTTQIEATMDVSNVANAIVFMSNLALDTNVQFMTIMATKMPYIGRG
jgi:NAD(P)-dependent dehydrogenase (short-subunit alcohol dehydrogenase family)